MRDGRKTSSREKEDGKEVKDFDPGAFGEAGIGQKDLIELKNRGYSNISRYIDSERDKGTAIGGRVEGSLEIMVLAHHGKLKGYNYKDFGDGKGLDLQMFGSYLGKVMDKIKFVVIWKILGSKGSCWYVNRFNGTFAGSNECCPRGN